MTTPNKYYFCDAFTGGATGALDSIDGLGLRDGDKAFVITSTSVSVFNLDADSAAAEDSPDVVSPDSNAGDKRWILLAFGSVTNATTVTSADTVTNATTVTSASVATTGRGVMQTLKVISKEVIQQFQPGSV